MCISVEESQDLFEKKTVSRKISNQPSLLSHRLENFNQSSNTFIDYAKFDGRVRFDSRKCFFHDIKNQDRLW